MVLCCVGYTIISAIKNSIKENKLVNVKYFTFAVAVAVVVVVLVIDVNVDV